MKPFRPIAIALALITLVGAPPLWAKMSTAPPDAIELPAPSVGLEPGDVVRIVIDALANNNRPYPDAGIDITFNFASPVSRARNGPLEKFSRMVKSGPYHLLIDHHSSDFSKVVFIDGSAFQMVNLVDADGRGVVYTFRLTRQRGGEYDGMWMTDSVWPVARHGVAATAAGE